MEAEVGSKKPPVIWTSILTMGLVITFLSDVVPVLGDHSWVNGPFSTGPHGENMRKMQAFKASLIRRDIPLSTSSASQAQPPQGNGSALVYHVISYGGDPTGKADSTAALLGALAAAVRGPSEGKLVKGMSNLGGARVDLDGGNYLISKPLRLPTSGVGNLVIHGGTLRASHDFPKDGYLIDLSSSSPLPSSYNYEYITFRDLLLDSNYRGGGISIPNSLRTTIDNCYVTHFGTTGIHVSSGHETFVRNTFLGQHITGGGDPGERNFSGTAVNLMGNDNALTDVVIFSAAIGVMISGQANILTGVHCYNKATGFGGTGIYLKLPGLTQTRIVNSYLDYTGIVAEDPVQLSISNCFFLGDAYVVLKSVSGVVNGVNIVDNMFSGSGRGVSIVQLDQSNGPFKKIDQVVVDRNIADGMALKATVAKQVVQGNGKSWTVDFNSVLLFPDLIGHVQYSLVSGADGVFPNHVLRNVTKNRIVVEANVAVPARLFVTVDQGVTI